MTVVTVEAVEIVVTGDSSDDILISSMNYVVINGHVVCSGPHIEKRIV